MDNDPWDELASPYVSRVSKALRAAAIDFAHKQILPPDSTRLHLVDQTPTVDPIFTQLSHLLNDLKTALHNLRSHQGYTITDFVRRMLSHRHLSNLSQSIEDCISSWVDREVVHHLVQALERPNSTQPKLEALALFRKRVVGRGFNKELQDLILRSKVFRMLENLLQDEVNAVNVREESAATIVDLVEFNRDVFVGLALMGPTARTLVLISSVRSVQILSKLIRLIKSALVDGLETSQEIPKILELFFSDENESMRVAAFECVLEIAYYARREVVEMMMETGVVEKLVELQRAETGRTEKGLELATKMGETESSVTRGGGLEGEEDEGVFERCVARFAVQLEVGERLGRKERRELKVEILRRVRECCRSEAEAATILAEVLWGSSP